MDVTLCVAYNGLPAIELQLYGGSPLCMCPAFVGGGHGIHSGSAACGGMWVPYDSSFVGHMGMQSLVVDELSYRNGAAAKLENVGCG